MRSQQVLALATCLAAACGGDDPRRVDVFVASSLTDVMHAVEEAVEDRHDLDVVVTAAGSSSLAAQIVEGAPADVFAAADLRTMQTVVDAGLVPAGPVVFARNRLAIAVERGNPLGISGLADLRDVTVVLAAPEVPAGVYSNLALEAAGVVLQPASYEQNVRAAAAKVALGEADAAIVYVTDVLARADELDAVEIAPRYQAEILYPVAALVGADPGAEIVLDTLLGEIGRRALTDAGFGLP